MANHKSAKKRIRTNNRKRIENKMSQSKVKTQIKKALASTDKEEAEKSYRKAVSLLDKSAAKGRIHPNNASRKKAELSKHLNNLKVV